VTESTKKPPPNGLPHAVKLRDERRRRWLREGEPSFARNLAQIGVLGWTVVTPTLIFLFAGRWIDRLAGTRIFWTAPLMLVGLAIGCWGAWRWIERT
jgi:ATP synthase protein I